MAGPTIVSKTAPWDLGRFKSQKSCKLTHYDQFLSSLCHNSTKTTDSTIEFLLYLLQMGAVSRVDWSPSSEGAGDWEKKNQVCEPDCQSCLMGDRSVGVKRNEAAGWSEQILSAVPCWDFGRSDPPEEATRLAWGRAEFPHQNASFL